MGQRFPGPTGSSQDVTAADPGTNVRGRSPTPGSVCYSRDPSLWQRAGYVSDAWDLAQARYARGAIVAHTEADFYELIRGAVPLLYVACGTVLTTTVVGAVAGSAFGGVGTIPGAAAGFSVGTALLDVLGLAFLAVYIKDRVKDIGAAFYAGASAAWHSCGEPGRIDQAARALADGVGLFYAALLQALLMYVGSALANKTLSAGRRALRGSRLFRSCEKLEAWINRNFRELYEKHLGKPAPGVLPPVSRDPGEWARYVDAIDLKAPPRDKGILWSKIGEQRAGELAAGRGLTSLEMLLKDTGFVEAYRETFGKDWNSTTRDIWRRLSERYARTLQGRVIGFVDDAAVLNSIRQSRVTPFNELVAGEPAIVDAPQITNELMEISRVMETNPNITVVEIRDVAHPDVTIKLMTRPSVLQSRAAPLQ